MKNHLTKFTSTEAMLESLIDDGDFKKEVATQLAERKIMKTIVSLRAARGVSQAGIAEKLGCGQSRVSKLERGKDDDLRLGELKSYADALGLKVEISLVPKAMTLAERVKSHAAAIQRLLNRMVKFAHLDPKIAEGVSKFHGEAFFNLVQMIKASGDNLARRPENESSYVEIDVIENSSEEVTSDDRRTRKSRKTAAAS